LAIHRLLDTVRVFHPTANKDSESGVGYQLLLLFEAVDKPLSAYQLRISSNLLGSDSESQGLEVSHCAVSYEVDSQSR
jgi:hypothetical protein